MPDCLERALQCELSEHEEHTYAPSLHDLTSNICAVFPDLRDDVVFVLEKTMKKTYLGNGGNAIKMVVEETEEKRHHRSAVMVYADKGDARSYLHDDGWDVYLPGVGDADDWKWITPGEQEEEEENLEEEESWGWLRIDTSAHHPRPQVSSSIQGYHGPGFKR